MFQKKQLMKQHILVKLGLQQNVFYNLCFYKCEELSVLEGTCLMLSLIAPAC